MAPAPSCVHRHSAGKAPQELTTIKDIFGCRFATNGGHLKGPMVEHQGCVELGTPLNAPEKIFVNH